MGEQWWEGGKSGWEGRAVAQAGTRCAGIRKLAQAQRLPPEPHPFGNAEPTASTARRYSAPFTRRLSHFISTLIPASATVAFLSSPTGYVGFTHAHPEYTSVKLLEFDARFGIFGLSDFFKWDLNHPTDAVDALAGKVDFAVIDPPFLNEVRVAFRSFPPLTRCISGHAISFRDREADPADSFSCRR